VYQDCKRFDTRGEFEYLPKNQDIPRMNLSRIRLAKGLSQRELAEMIGVSQPTIQRAELLHRGSTMGTYIDSAAALGVTLADLFENSRTGVVDTVAKRLAGLPEASQAEVLAILDFVESRAKNSRT